MNSLAQRDRLPLVGMTENPFDSLRRVDADGEYWLARELMPVLGYSKWERFADAIDRAKAACENIGNSYQKHFFPDAGKNSQGRPREDYRLSRLAAYLTAMNGDPRKPEIALAQSYFAVKTREAEVNDDRLQLLEAGMKQLQSEILELKQAFSGMAISGKKPSASKKIIIGTQAEPIPQTIDSVDELTEAVRRRNLAEMEAVGTPGTTQYERAKTVSRGLRFGWKR